jgi:RNA polymerase sigma factor (sigma-70 family)
MNSSKRQPPSDDIQDVRTAVRLVLRRLVGAEDPEYEDLVQSAIEHVLLTFERGQFRGDCPKGGWAAVIARNVAIDAIRARSRERQLFAHDDADVTEAGPSPGHDLKLGPEHLTGVQERLRRVKSALLGLGAQKSNVVFLHDVLGHELPDVAGILGISVAAAQSRLVRGRRAIVAELDVTPGPIGRSMSENVGEPAGRPAGMKSGPTAVVTKTS